VRRAKREVRVGLGMGWLGVVTEEKEGGRCEVHGGYEGVVVSVWLL